MYCGGKLHILHTSFRHALMYKQMTYSVYKRIKGSLEVKHNTVTVGPYSFYRLRDALPTFAYHKLIIFQGCSPYNQGDALR